MRVLVNYADKKYSKTQKFNSFTGRYRGDVDRVIQYSPDDIDVEFRNKYHHIFEHSRGNGLWLWKPYLIRKTLLTLEEGDILFYSDSGSFFIRSIKYIEKRMGQDDIWISGLPLIEKQYTKKDAFLLMNCLSGDYVETNQASGTFLMFRKSSRSMKFVEEWLEYCCDIRILGPQKSVLGEEDDLFIQHREDQSVLSLLAKKYGLVRHQDPSQYGRFPEKYNKPGRIYKVETITKEYPVIIVHHRTPNVELNTTLRQLLCIILPKKIAIKFMKT